MTILPGSHPSLLTSFPWAKGHEEHGLLLAPRTGERLGSGALAASMVMSCCALQGKPTPPPWQRGKVGMGVSRSSDLHLPPPPTTVIPIGVEESPAAAVQPAATQPEERAQLACNAL